MIMYFEKRGLKIKIIILTYRLQLQCMDTLSFDTELFKRLISSNLKERTNIKKENSRAHVCPLS